MEDTVGGDDCQADETSDISSRRERTAISRARGPLSGVPHSRATSGSYTDVSLPYGDNSIDASFDQGSREMSQRFLAAQGNRSALTMQSYSMDISMLTNIWEGAIVSLSILRMYLDQPSIPKCVKTRRDAPSIQDPIFMIFFACASSAESKVSKRRGARYSRRVIMKEKTARFSIFVEARRIVRSSRNVRDRRGSRLI